MKRTLWGKYYSLFLTLNANEHFSSETATREQTSHTLPAGFRVDSHNL